MDIKIEDYEKLGSFYLGREYDLGHAQVQDRLVMYDSKDLVTHGVVLGMTGSGKTGLCLTLIEEAAIDGVPAVIIDPKGDLANLLLAFPTLSGEAFRPWVNEEDAQKKGQTADDYAASEAAKWKKGLGDWGQGESRIGTLRDKVEMAIYTPGSNAGIPVSILSSFKAPPFEVVDDAEIFGERIESTVSSLLALVGIDADPIQSREHILLSNILSNRWQAGEDLTLANLIKYIQSPPFSAVGVVDIESFYPEKKRNELAMSINNLLAAPGFQAWLQGVPLDVKTILHTPEGKPRLAIFNIAHLNDAERMFFVSLMLNQMLGWMRSQPGTTSLRALLYMDEIMGYLPPTANPPSKKPMLTMLKQGRAFGLGVLLATQNPVDLDYKAMANMGTWWLGRLQTERDKARVIEGLEGAAAAHNSGFDRGKIEQQLAGLSNRIFLMNNSHEDGPVVFQVRWTMSYLRGPLTRSQIKVLMDPERERLMAHAIAPGQAGAKTSGGKAVAKKPASRAADIGEAGGDGPPPLPSRGAAGAGPSTTRPPVPSTVQEYFVPVAGGNPNDVPVTYLPYVIRAAEIQFTDRAKGVDTKKAFVSLTPIDGDATAVDFSNSERLDDREADFLTREPDAQAEAFVPPPAYAMKPAVFTNAKTEFLEACYARETLELLHHAGLDAWSQPGETEADFRARLDHTAREQRDAAMEELRRTFAKKAAPLEERLRRAEAAVEKQKSEQKGAWMQTAVAVGSSVLGALLGGRKGGVGSVTRGASAVRQAGQAWRQGQDVDNAEESVAAVNALLDDLDAQAKAEMEALKAKFDVSKAPLETVKVAPLKKNILVTACGLAWVPHFTDGKGKLEAAWE